MITDLLVQNVSELISAKSIIIFKSFLEKMGKVNTYNNDCLFQTKDFSKLSLFFEPTCLLDNINDQICVNEDSAFRYNFYPVKKEKALNILKKICRERGRIFIHEKLFLKFPEYLELNNNTYKFLMLKEGYLPLTWRFYLAIMVLF